MGYKTLELTLISAKDLKDVTLIGKMDVYVAVSLSEEPKSKQRTPVHTDSGPNPSWNYTMRFTVDDAVGPRPKYLGFVLKHEQTFGADKEIGEILVPVRELFDSFNGKDPSVAQFVTYQVKRSSGRAKGELKLSYKFVDLASHNVGFDAGSSKPEQVSGYGAPSGSQSYPPPPYQGAGGYPPHQVAGAYPPPQQAPVWYPAPHQGPPGGYPPPQHAPAGHPAPQQGPPTGYPAPQQGPPAGYPAPHQGPPAGYPTGAPYAAPQGYPPYGGCPPAGGYPPPGAGGYPQYPAGGYANNQKPQKQKKNNNFGMGLGAGLLGGAIGGLVIGEALDDAFDGGDDGGFDF